jgi:hypothetical protein
MSLAPFKMAAVHATPNGGTTNARIEVQLRAQLADLEARVADLSRCLEDAEQRAGELLTMQAWAALLEQRMAVILSSRSWRLTTPLRRIMKDVRGSASR